MGPTNCVKKYINQLPIGLIFTTRDFLSFGKRAAIDQALHRLVKSGYIKRLARGVFIKPDWAKPRISAEEVAWFKANGFGKKIMTDCADVACQLGLLGQGNKEPTFAVNGRSSSFKYGETVIHFKGTSARKMQLAVSRAGRTIRALWYLGKESCNQKAIARASSWLLASQTQLLLNSGQWMPAWLAEYLVRPRYLRTFRTRSKRVASEREVFETPHWR